MAKNLRAKISDTDTLVIYDKNGGVTSKFVKEMASSAGGRIPQLEVARNPREVAERSVCRSFSYLLF